MDHSFFFFYEDIFSLLLKLKQIKLCTLSKKKLKNCAPLVSGPLVPALSAVLVKPALTTTLACIDVLKLLNKLLFLGLLDSDLLEILKLSLV